MVVILKNFNQTTTCEERETNIIKSFLICLGSTMVLKAIPYTQISSKKPFQLMINIFTSIFLLGTLELLKYVDTKQKPSQFVVRIYITIFILFQHAYFTTAAYYTKFMFECKEETKICVILMLANIYYPITCIVFYFIDFKFDLQMVLCNILANVFIQVNILHNEKMKSAKTGFLLTLYLTFIQLLYVFILHNLIALCY